jgi:hypothetical protein
MKLLIKQLSPASIFFLPPWSKYPSSKCSLKFEVIFGILVVGFWVRRYISFIFERTSSLIIIGTSMTTRSSKVKGKVVLVLLFN